MLSSASRAATSSTQDSSAVGVGLCVAGTAQCGVISRCLVPTQLLLYCDEKQSQHQYRNLNARKAEDLGAYAARCSMLIAHCSTARTVGLRYHSIVRPISEF